MSKTVDVVIPAYRPGTQFRELLSRLLAQDHPIRHIYIMNTEEQYWDYKPEEQAENITVEHLKKADFDHAGTRDRAIRKGDGELVLCMTQDALPADRQLVGRLVRAFDDPTVKASYARQLPNRECALIERLSREFNYPPESCVKAKSDLPDLGIKTFFCSNVCAMYERETYLSLGGFQAPAIFNEDMVFAAGLTAAGWRIAYQADARVFHSHNYSGFQQLRRNFDLAVSQACHPEVFDGISSEGEGIRLVRRTALYLLRHKPLLLPKLIWQSGCKYLGFFLGKHYRLLPKAVLMKLTMNQDYWR